MGLWLREGKKTPIEKLRGGASIGMVKPTPLREYTLTEKHWSS
jgi:hypothetical protein